MFKTDYLPFFKLQLQISSFFRAQSVFWDLKSNQLHVLNPKYTRIHRLGIILLLLRTVLMFWKTQEILKSREWLMYQKIIAGYICLAMLAASVSVLFIYFHRDKICAFVNLLPNFEKQLKGTPASNVAGYIRYISYLGIISINLLSISFSLLNIFLPCMPPYTGSYLLDCDGSYWNWKDLIKKTATISFEIWMNFFACSNAMWGGFFILFGGIMFIKNYLNIIGRLRFTLRVFRLFKELQIFVDIFNEIHQTGIFPMTQLSVIGLPVFSIFLSIKLYSEIPLLLFVFNILVIIDSMIFQAVAFGLAGKIHSISEEAIQTWKREHFYKKSKDKKNKAFTLKIICSLSPMKIKFGSNNYLEKDTCLSIIQFTLNLVSSTLLTLEV